MMAEEDRQRLADKPSAKAGFRVANGEASARLNPLTSDNAQENSGEAARNDHAFALLSSRPGTGGKICFLGQALHFAAP
jgi:hypothetical protein